MAGESGSAAPGIARSNPRCSVYICLCLSAGYKEKSRNRMSRIDIDAGEERTMEHL